MGGFCFLRGIGGVGNGIRNGNGRWRWQTVSSGVCSGTDNCGQQEQGQSEAAPAAE